MFSISLISSFFMRATRMSKMAKNPTNMDNEIIGKISIFSIVVMWCLMNFSIVGVLLCRSSWFNFNRFDIYTQTLQVSNHRNDIFLRQ